MSAPTLPGELEDRIRIEDFGSIQYFTSLSCGIESSLENPIDKSSNSLDGVVMGSRASQNFSRPCVSAAGLQFWTDLTKRLSNAKAVTMH